MKRLIIYFLLIHPILATAQDTLSPELPFFEEQAKVYQRWLEHSGLGKVLKVYIVELDTENTVDTFSLYLAFHTENTDTIINAWNQLKRDFEARSPLTLEERLSYKMTELMEIEQERGYVQLYDTYDLAKTACFFVGVYYDGEVKVEESICRSEIKDIYIPANNLSGLKIPTERTLQNLDYETRAKIFEAILEFGGQRFKVNDCSGNPEIRVREKRERLRFEADNLCRHVLYDQMNNLVCKIYKRLFGYECSTIKRERLTFTFTFNEYSSDAIKLTCEIDGKYSNNWLSGRGAYRPMEGEFDEYLELFADTFVVELEEWFQ